jgi:hypothetical protein
VGISSDERWREDAARGASPSARELLEAVLAGSRDPDIEGVDVGVAPALAAVLPDMLNADGYLFGTTANFGYMSGALKH